MEGIDLLRRSTQELRAGHGVAECVVLYSEGSVARPAGARMIVLADGACLGTVGGGGPELRCQRLALDAIARGKASLVTLDRLSTGMVCGGSQLVGIRPLGAADLEALDAALGDVAAGLCGVLSCSWGSPVEAQTQPDGEAPLGDDRVGPILELGIIPTFTYERYEGGLSGRTWPAYEDGRFFELVCAPERALIFGGGHVGAALVPVLASIGFEVVLYDSRPEVARPELHPAASRVVCASYACVEEHLEIRPGDYVCVMTHGHAADEDVVAQVLPHHPRYLGCMGSRKKRAVLEEVLAGKGLSLEDVATVELPIGLEIGAVTPAEIAVSIAARIIQLRHEVRLDSRPCPSGG